ncbi:deoxyribodipyrimidine photo-lyase [Chryseolinea sp. H1M3-3]|uniref:cryptochrome/photolyase family protein n=1 Tax=Chryseolinea sp. H1M3-3 TaxID=3034144 RepID=UPI0023EE180E|nr:deoxyribodipyrimidine photo-lyase [Chryseolinea sp. H1M3-3]
MPAHLNPPSAAHYINNDTAIWWIRRDIRLEDNTALFHALKENKKVLPLFIFDSNILGLLEDKTDKRVDFIHQSLALLKNKLEKLSSSLLVLYGNPVDIFKIITPTAVYANHDYEPYGIKRDAAVASVLNKKDVLFKTYKDHVIFEKEEILKPDGTPYTIFTPYAKTWKQKLSEFYYKSYPSERYLKNLQKVKSLSMPTLADLGFIKSVVDFPERVIKTATIEKYHLQRNFPSIKGTTRLSVHLRFGTVSIRKLVQVALKKNETWLNELIWREFFQMILWHFPHVVDHAFKPAYDRVEWRNNPKEFEAWCEGKTGYPIVDAGMRELNATGFMHNRVRMIAASFLTKHLLIDWRWGEAYFAKKLLDYELASNNGGWQWAAGSGCDAAPYFRVFNPQLQTEKFDPDFKYIKIWVPELNTSKYPLPIVDHKMARERVIKVYRLALQGS